MSDVCLYTTRFCSYCMRAKLLLEHKSIEYREISVDGDPEKRREMMAASGRRTVPQIWVGGTHIGGCTELYALESSGELDRMLAEAAGNK